MEYKERAISINVEIHRILEITGQKYHKCACNQMCYDNYEQYLNNYETKRGKILDRK